MTFVMNYVKYISGSCMFLRQTPHLWSLSRVRFLACQSLPNWNGKQRNNHYITIGNNHSKSLLEPSRYNFHITQFCAPITRHARSSPKIEDRLKREDSIPEGYELVYRAPMSMYVLAAKGVSTLSLLLLCVVAVYKTVEGNMDFVSLPSKIGDIVENHEQIALLIVTLLVLSLAIRNLASSYPVRIYHKNKSYISVFTGELPLKTKQIKFRQGDVTQMEAKGILPWRDAKYSINHKKIILLEDYFRVPSDLIAMMEPDSTK